MAKEIRIASHVIGKNNPAFIVAEVGVNHNGDLGLAKQLVDTAKSVGASAVKFQVFNAKDLVTENAPLASYQKKVVLGRSHFELLRKLQLSRTDFEFLFDYCHKKKIIFLATPFDSGSADFLQQLGVHAFKISSGDLTNLPLLRQVANFKKPIILSTGMSTLKEVGDAVENIYSAKNRRLILLHCTSNYPTEYRNVNLRAMCSLRKKFSVSVGYSDHTRGIEVSVAAVAMGACVVERHLTLDRSLPGPDHAASLDPLEFERLVRAIRNIESAMGNGIKKPCRSETEVKNVARKSIVASQNIAKGTVLSEKILAFKRPGTGLSPSLLRNILGKRTKRKLKKDTLVRVKDLARLGS